MKHLIFLSVTFIGLIGFISMMVSAIYGILTNPRVEAESEYRRVMCYISGNTRVTQTFTSQDQFLTALDKTFGKKNTYYAWGDCSRYEKSTTPRSPQPAQTPSTPKPAVTPQTPKPAMTARPAITPRPPQTPRPKVKRPIYVHGEVNSKDV